MFGSKNNKENIMANNNQVSSGDTIVSQGTRIKGDLNFSGTMYLEGGVEGSIISSNDDDLLVISETGRVNGSIKTGNLNINGTVEGDVTVTGKMEVSSKARINGNIYYVNIEMETGSQVNGQLIYQGGEVTPLVNKKSEKNEQ